MKPLLPIAAALILCGGTAALLADTASADTPRRPMMVAALTPRLILPAVTAAPPADGGSPQNVRRPEAVRTAAQRKQMCQAGYAHQVGELAYLEALLNLTSPQQLLFDRWKSAKLEIAKHHEADCSVQELAGRAVGTRPSLPDGMAREEDMLKRRLADLEAELPALKALYGSLNAAQQDALANPGAMAERRMFAVEMGPRSPFKRGRGPQKLRPPIAPPPGAAPTQ